MTSCYPHLRTAGLLFALIVLFGCVAGSAHAQYGKIRGVVTDAAGNEPLPGVNVYIDGTTQGTSTDVNGEYVIIGLRPDTYTIVASYVGFQTTRVNDVRVSIDQTTTLDISLQEEIVLGEEVVVTAQRPLVQRDLTATTATVTSEEIQALPLENFSDVVNLQAGVVNGHFRGGRIGEVGYWVDGLPVTDAYDGGLSVSIENDMVQELQVVTGAFNAEYGQAMSGIVNVVTRDGSNTFSGSFSGYLGDYLTSATNTFPDLDSVSPTAVRNGELNLSGPIVKDRLFFFTSGRYFGNDGWINGRNVFGFDDVGIDPTGKIALMDEDGFSGDSSIVPLNPYEKISGQAKLTWRLSRGIRVAVNAILSQEDYKDYDRTLFFFPQGQLDRKRWGRSVYLKWTHTLSNRTFYEAGFTNNHNEYRQRLFEDAEDERYMPQEFFGYTEPTRTSEFRIGGTDNNRFSRRTDTYLGKIDLSSQVTNQHLLKTGVEMRLHTLDYNDEYIAVIPEIDRRFVAWNGKYTRKPFEASAYLQDKVEIGSLIVNAGLRFDYFDSNGEVVADPRDPNAVLVENRLRNAVPGEDGLPDFLPDEYFKPASAKWQISPRLGVAFPITAGGVIHFSYGHFFQTPNFELLYQNPWFLLGNTGSGLLGLVGNADLEPEKTINGEIGLKQELGSGSALELTAYYRDIRNLTGTATDPIVLYNSSIRYGMLVNSDFGFVRGVILRFDQRFGSNFFMNADYTYQIAKANASDPDQVYQAAAAKQQLEKQIIPTNWDQRHTINLSLAYNDATRYHWGFGLIAGAGSGQPYTPSQTTAQTGVILPTKIPLNSEIKPFTFNVNLSAYKDIVLPGNTRVQVFGRIDNVLDTMNENDVFGDTGRATYSLQRNIDQGSFRGNPVFLDRWYVRPDWFSQPRRVVIGLSLNF